MSNFADLGRMSSESARLVRRQKAGSLPIMAPAGTLRLREVFGQACWCAFLFVWVLLMHVQNYRFNNPGWTAFLTWFVVAIVLLLPVVAFAIYTVGMWRTISISVARFSACVYWLYWPFWRLVLCFTAVVLATNLGDGLWFNNFRLYEEYYRLQAYDNVDTTIVTGTRLQDAGLVRFNTSAGVDRSRAGCMINGRTYCVAPIVLGGVVKPGVPQTNSGSQDLFMAGIDCCNCPVTDFRCGDWDDQSGKLGGMRLLDKENARMFRLAGEKFTANYEKVMAHGVFFEWKNEPIVAWKKLWGDGFHLVMLYCIFGTLGSFTVVVILNGIMRMLTWYQLAAPIDEHPPQLPMFDGLSNLPLGQAKRGFIPHEYKSYMEQREPKYHQWEQRDPQHVIL